MALRTDRNPHRSEIANEFGPNTLTSITSWRELDAMYTHILGTGLHNREDFKGLGQPTVSTITASPIADTKTVRIAVTGNRNGVTSYVRVRYSDDDFNTDNNYGGQVNLNDGTVTNIDLTMPLYETVYYFRVYVYNAFNNDSGDWNKYPTSSSSYSATTDTPPPLLTLEAQDYSWDGFGNIITYFSYGVDENSTPQPENYDNIIYWNNGTYTDSNTTVTRVAGNFYRCTMNRTAFNNIAPGQNITTSITAKHSNYTNVTDSYSEVVAPDAPSNLSLSQPNQYTGELTASWSNNESSGDTWVQWQRSTTGGSTWNDDGAAVQVPIGGTSTSKTYPNGYLVRFKAWHEVNSTDSAIQTASSLTVNVIEPVQAITQAASSITGSGADLGGQFTRSESGTTVYYWQYRQGTSGGWTSTFQRTNSISTNFTTSESITGLDPNTLYEFRAVGYLEGEQADTTDYGLVDSFTTADVTLQTPTNVNWVIYNSNQGIEVTYTIPSGQPTGVTYRAEVDWGDGNGYQLLRTGTDVNVLREPDCCFAFGFGAFTFNSPTGIRVKAIKFPDETVWATGAGIGTVQC